MGEVYRARDTKLDRDVALKILPEAFAHDEARLARFQREATTLASLNHPHIAHIHGIEESSGVQRAGDGAGRRRRRSPSASRAGRSRSTRRCRSPGRLPRARSRTRARHRPSRSEAGQHQARGPMAPSRCSTSASRKRWWHADQPPPSDSPTITSPAMTGAGVILGTAAYMAPEQAKRHAGGSASRHLGVRLRPLRDADGRRRCFRGTR